MRLLRSSWLLKIFMILCISLQCITLFPHHHDNGSDAICFNIRHCIETHSDFKDHLGCSHSSMCSGHNMQKHNHAKHGLCAVDNIVVLKPQNDRAEDQVHPVCLPIAHTQTLAISLDMCSEHYISTVLLLNIEERSPHVEPLIITYITKALSLRAPNILA